MNSPDHENNQVDETVEEEVPSHFDPEAVLSDAMLAELSNPEPLEQVVEDPLDDGGLDDDGSGEPAADDLDNVQIEQLADGRLRLGKYVADDYQSLLVEVERGRRHSERLAHEKANTPPAEVQSTDSDDEYLSDEEWAQFNQWQAQQANGTGQANQLESLQRVQARMQLKNVLGAANSREDFQGLAQAAIELNDPVLHEQIMREWENFGDQIGVMSHVRQLEQAQAAAQEYHALQEAEAQHNNELQNRQREVAAFQQTQQQYIESNPDWQMIDPGVNLLLQQNPDIMKRAKALEAAGYQGEVLRAWNEVAQTVRSYAVNQANQNQVVDQAGEPVSAATQIRDMKVGAQVHAGGASGLDVKSKGGSAPQEFTDSVVNSIVAAVGGKV